MDPASRFDQLIGEGNSEPIDGWDFSWFSGRATEARPPWKYFEGVTTRMSAATSVLDIQTGGGERFADAIRNSTHIPRELAATESWSPNVAIARLVLEPLGVSVHEVSEKDPLPFEDTSFDLICSRHPTLTQWSEIARVLQFGGTYFAQQVGAGTNRELTEFMMGPQPESETQRVDRAISSAIDAGLQVIDVREESMPVEFFDIGAVVYFLRKVIWTVPDFSTDRYREPLKRMHNQIEVDGSFISHSRRYLLEARK